MPRRLRGVPSDEDDPLCSNLRISSVHKSNLRGGKPMRRLLLAMFLVVVISLATVVPAFAIVDPVTPICDGEAASNGAAGGAAADSNPSASPVGPPFPAKGLTNSGTNACP